MTEYTTFPRRKTDQINSNSDNKTGTEHRTPSRIPIKSPARSSKAIGGMTVAYSPIKSSNTSVNSPDTTSSNSNNNNYSKKLLELKNAMDLLKTPPAAAPASSPLQSHSSHVTYTPIKSSTLATNHSTSPFASVIDSIEISMASSSSSSDTETAGNDSSILDAYREEDSLIKAAEDSFTTSRPSVTSSPYISPEELKKRLEATKEAFQRSLDAQKRRLRTSLPFSELESSFGFDSDLSIDSLKDTRDQLEKIKKEMADIIESDFEDVETIRARNKQQETNNLIVKNESWSSNLLKYFVIFSIATIIFIHFFINYLPTIKSTMISFVTSFDKENILERIEETLNFLLQDD